MTKQEKLLSALGNVRDEYVEESDLTSAAIASRFRKRRILTIGIAAALVCSLVAVGAALVLNRDDGETAGDRMIWETKYVKTNLDQDLDEEIAYVPTWEEKTTIQRYPLVEYKGVWYSASSYLLVSEGTAVTSDRLGGKLGEAVLTGYDNYTDSEYSTKGELFGIDGIDPDCAVAVLMEGESEAYVYIDYYYRPSTLGDLVNGLSLEENLTFGSVYYDFVREEEFVTVEFPEVPAEKIWELLSDRKTAPVVYNTAYDELAYRKVMSVSVNVPLLGIQNQSLNVIDNGYITTNIMGQGRAFYIGTEKTEAFVQYVLTRCKGYEIVYITDGDDAVPEVGDGGFVETVTAVSSAASRRDDAAFSGNAASPVVSD